MAKILLIDDEYSIRFTMSEILRTEGHDVDAVPDAEEALQRTEKDEYDVVITDILLPKMNGLDLIKKIYDQYPETLFIVISGEPNLSTATEAVRIGVFDYLTKPIKAKVIRRVVANAYNVKVLKQQKNQLELEIQRYNDQLETLVKQRTAKLKKLNQDLKQEIRKRKDVESRLPNILGQLAAISDHLPDLVALIDKDQNLKFTNRAFKKRFLQLKTDSPSDNLKPFLTESEYSEFQHHIKSALNGQKTTMKHSFSATPGPPIRFLCQFFPFQSGQDNEVLIFYREIANGFGNSQTSGIE